MKKRVCIRCGRIVGENSFKRFFKTHSPVAYNVCCRCRRLWVRSHPDIYRKHKKQLSRIEKRLRNVPVVVSKLKDLIDTGRI